MISRFIVPVLAALCLPTTGCSEDAAEAGGCTSASDCDDDDPVTIDSCNSSGICIHEADTTPPGVTSSQVSAVTTDSFQVEWSLDEPSHGQLAWGLTGDYGSLTTRESDFLTTHTQSLNGLAPGTEYHWRILGEDQAGNVLTGPDNVTTTEEPPGVPFSSYGAVGDGTTDDTEAIQAALDAESRLIADPGATYLISSQIDVDQPGDQAVNWNGSTVTANVEVPTAFMIDKRAGGGAVYFEDLTVEGNRVIEFGFWILSVASMDDVDVQNMYSDDTNALGFRIEINDDPNAFGTYDFDGCDCSDMESEFDNVLGNSLGASRCLIVRWFTTPPDTKINFSNSTFTGAWGDDGDLVQIEDHVGDIKDTESRLSFTNMVFGDYSRRSIKGTSGGVTFTGCTFIDTDPSNSRLVSSVPSSGMVVSGAFNGLPNSGAWILDGCTFDGSGGYDGRMIPSNTDGMIIKNCVFTGGSDIAMTNSIGDVDICGSTFEVGSSIYDYNESTDTGLIRIDVDNVHPAGYIQLDVFDYVEQDLPCD